MYPSIILKKDKEKSMERKHPWIFSGAIHKIIVEDASDLTLPNGEIVKVFSASEKYLCTGHFQEGTIAIRILSFKDVVIDEQFWIEKLKNALQLREKLSLTNTTQTNIYRLAHAEGDGLSGLILDYYNGTVVIQSHTLGMHKAKPMLVEAIKKVYGENLIAIYDKSAETMAKQTDVIVENGYLFKQREPIFVGLENDCNYHLDWVDGQKTGFFIDQRENRKLLGELAKNKVVLNTFCYSGGFSVAALKNGATAVHSVDSSKKAIELTNKNIVLNKLKNHTSFVADTLDFLKEMTTEYDIIVLDPPAYAKNQKAKHNAVQGYKRLNETAIRKIKSGGILFTFSCSQAVSSKLFYDTIMAAAISSGRNARVLYHLSQPADHPVNIYHPEGEYLKGLVIEIFDL